MQGHRRRPGLLDQICESCGGWWYGDIPAPATNASFDI